MAAAELRFCRFLDPREPQSRGQKRFAIGKDEEMTPAQVRQIVRKVFATNGKDESLADAVVLEFDVRMRLTVARAAHGTPWSSRMLIQFGSRWTALSKAEKAATVAHEACHLFTTGDHGTEWQAAMEAAGYGSHVADHAAVLDQDASVSDEYFSREARDERNRQAREYRKTEQHKADLARRKQMREENRATIARLDVRPSLWQRLRALLN